MERDAPCQFEWRHITGKVLTEGTIQGGFENNGDPLLVGRSLHEECYIPGKVQPIEGVCYMPLNGTEYKVNRYEVLIGDPTAFKWVKAENGEVPENAVIGGAMPNNDLLYIGRVEHATTMGKSLVVGRVYPAEKRFYYGYSFVEYSVLKYEVLVKV